MSYIIDLSAIAIIVLVAFMSARIGFVRTTIELVGFVAIILISNSVSIPIAEAIYDTKIQQSVLNYAGSENPAAQLPADDFLKSLPDYLTKDNGFLAVDKQKIIDCYDNNIKAGSDKIAAKINGDVIRPAAVKVIAVIISTIMFAVLSVVVHLVARLLNGAVNHSFARGINQKLGFIIGIPKGAVIALILCLLLALYVNNTNNDLWIFTRESVNNSYATNVLKAILPNYGIFSYIKF